jgi:hypothetical protein
MSSENKKQYEITKIKYSILNKQFTYSINLFWFRNNENDVISPENKKKITTAFNN